MFTVKDVLQLPIMQQANLATEAKSRLQTPVDWVSIIEMPVENFVRKNEFVLSAGIGCEEDENKLLTFTKEVMEAEAAALVIATGRYITNLPEKVIQFCEEHGFPLIELPWEVRFADVSHAISTALHQKERSLVEYSDKVRKEMLEIILKGEGIAKIASYLGKSLHMPVVITDRRGIVKSKSKSAKALEEKWNAHLLTHGDPLYFQHDESNETISLPNNMHWIHTDTVTILQLAIQSAREVQGFLLLEWPEHLQEDDVFSEQILILLEHAVTSSALCFLHDQAALETEMRLKDDFVWSLAKGKFDSTDTALSRAKSLGYNLKIPYLCLIAKPENLSILYDQEPFGNMSFENWLKQLGDMLEEEVYHTGRTMHLKTMSTFQKEELIIYVELLSEKSIETAFPFIELLQYRLTQKYPRLVVSWGIAKTFGKDSFHTGFQEAYSALDIGRRQKGEGYISTYADTRFDRALLALAENEELRKITDIIIAPLQKYSRERNIDLVHTFMVYNRHRGNVSQTARELNLHRQSLLYRLRKIETLTGCSLDNSDDTFLIDLSIRLHTISAQNDPGTIAH
ncbi:PucR family transcriptional regulator [Alteribacillus bidgolensis]|uniref:Purine catabolism regulatory protein n=1 Tax=Alteribacillus bidgolensis TaxID=930129 RepID=A0A1G8CCK1_9BACI|nr:PucR family transcriptional regulator [Alteribacillus bidgolensis]SDH43237.1 purine catabolism regulatory protein [Alteribacillus bidgolensis]